MGDTGSLAIGGLMGAIAVMIKQEILLVLVGGLFVIEASSVILQVASFKLRGNRIFRMAPLHHHFELKGWSEPKVIIRFWIIAIALALMAWHTETAIARRTPPGFGPGPERLPSAGHGRSRAGPLTME